MMVSGECRRQAYLSFIILGVGIIVGAAFVIKRYLHNRLTSSERREGKYVEKGLKISA